MADMKTPNCEETMRSHRMRAPIAPSGTVLRRALGIYIVLVWGGTAGCGETTKAPDGYQGIVELDERSLAFEVGGKLLEVAVREGDTVEPGALLARLDSTLPSLELQALNAQADATKAELDLLYEGARPEEIEQARVRVQAAKAAFQASEREFVRAQTLFESHSITEQHVDEVRLRLDQNRAAMAEAEQRLKERRLGSRAQEIAAGEARLAAAESSAEAARERIRRHELSADDNTEVLDVPRRFGEFVSPGTTVVLVGDTTRPHVEMFVPQKDVGKMKVGTPVTVLVDALPLPLGGRIEHIARAMEYSPRFLFSPAERPYLVLRVRVRIRDDNRQLHAGTPAFVTLGASPELRLPETPRTVSPAVGTAIGTDAGTIDGKPNRLKPDDISSSKDKSPTGMPTSRKKKTAPKAKKP